jgi:hypothetical protein
MEATIERHRDDGWQSETDAQYGFTFIRRNDERRLLMLTPRDPCIKTLESRACR